MTFAKPLPDCARELARTGGILQAYLGGFIGCMALDPAVAKRKMRNYRGVPPRYVTSSVEVYFFGLQYPTRLKVEHTMWGLLKKVSPLCVEPFARAMEGITFQILVRKDAYSTRNSWNQATISKEQFYDQEPRTDRVQDGSGGVLRQNASRVYWRPQPSEGRPVSLKSQLRGLQQHGHGFRGRGNIPRGK